MAPPPSPTCSSRTPPSPSPRSPSSSPPLPPFHLSLLSLVLLFSFLADVSSKPTPGIQGSSARTAGGASLLRGTLSCFSKRGGWALNPSPRKLPWIRQEYGRETQCDQDRKERSEMQGEEADRVAEEGGREGREWRVREEAKWEWRMERCPWEDFSYEKFCKVMFGNFGINASILIVGDELSWGFERRFFYKMLAGASKNYFPVNLFPNGCPEYDKGRDRKLCSGYRYCHDILDGHSVAVRFVRSGNLSLTRNTVDFKHTPWISAMSFWRPSVAIFSHSERDVTDDEFEKDVTVAADWVTGRYRETLFIYRNMPTTATFCPDPTRNSFSQPPPNFEFPDKIFERQNAIAKKIVEEGGLFLDVDVTVKSRPKEMLNFTSRPKSCISLCQPGIIDSWVDLFFNTILVSLPKVDFEKMETKNGAFFQPLEDRNRVRSCENLELLLNKTKKMSEEEIRKKDEKIRGILSVRSPIPGSKIKSKTSAENLRRKFDCFMTKGKWVYNSKPRYLPWLVVPWALPSYISRCDQRQLWYGGIYGPQADEVVERGGNWSVREDLKYEWKTPKCPLETFSRKGFCEAMGPGRSILLVGDSMTSSFERHIFFNLLMGSDKEKYPPVDILPDGGKEYDIAMRRFTCRGTAFCHEMFEKPVEVRFCFNRAASLTKVPLDGEAPWITQMERWKPSILVINRGAHFCDDPVFEIGVRNTMEYIRENYPDTLVIWRNTPPGHVNCMDYHHPTAKRQDPDSLPKPYHWADFPAQNEVARKIVEEFGGIYFDVDNSTSLRADGHRGSNDAGAPDCLHYCEPGPEDTWVQLLYNVLKHLV